MRSSQTRLRLVRRGSLMLMGLAMLHACGGGGTEGSVASKDPPTTVLRGVAVDGYIEGATIRCLDATGTIVASAQSGEKGAWSLELPPDKRCHTVESVGGQDVGLGDGTTTPILLGDSTVYRAQVAHLSPSVQSSATLVISPITSLIATLQQSATLGPEAARARVIQSLAPGSQVDPLTTDPIATNNLALFKGGYVAATLIREIAQGIGDSLASSGSGPEIATAARIAARGVVGQALATSIADGSAVVTDLELSARTLASEALRQLSTQDRFKSAISAIPQSLTTLAIGEFARSAAHVLAESTSATAITQVAAAQVDTINKQRKANLLSALYESNRSNMVERLAQTDAKGLLQSIQRALQASGAEGLVLALPDGGDDEKPVDSGVTSYIEIVENQAWVLTTNLAPQAAPLADFDDGIVLTGAGALRGVAVQIGQSTVRPQLGTEPRRVTLAFTVVKDAGTRPLFLSATVAQLGLRWINDRLSVDTNGSSLIGSFNLAGSTPTSVRIPFDDQTTIGKLVTVENGSLTIDLAALGGAYDAAKSLLQSGTFRITAVIEDPSIPLVFATRDQAGAPIPIDPIAKGVEVSEGVFVNGPGFQGTITLN